MSYGLGFWVGIWRVIADIAAEGKPMVQRRCVIPAMLLEADSTPVDLTS
jgi:hypothetical protein